MICPQCHGAVDEQAAACSRCGAPLGPSVQCGLCRAVNRPSSKFCDQCGNLLQIGTRLRLAQASLDLGLFCGHKNRFDDARDYIARSIDLFDRCGADMLLVEARVALDDLPR